MIKRSTIKNNFNGRIYSQHCPVNQTSVLVLKLVKVTLRVRVSYRDFAANRLNMGCHVLGSYCSRQTHKDAVDEAGTWRQADARMNCVRCSVNVLVDCYHW